MRPHVRISVGRFDALNALDYMGESMQNAAQVSQTYITDWVANTYGTNAAHVGSAARSMWVAPEGTVYTASMWDENEGGIAIYLNGQDAGSIGAHNDVQGGAITGNATNIYTPLQFKPLSKSGVVARYNRVSKARDQVLQVSDTTTEQKADVITGLAFWGHWLHASDFPGNRVRVYNTARDFWELDIPLSNPGAIAIDRDGNICVAQAELGRVTRFTRTGEVMDVIDLGPTARPSALFFDPTTRNLWIGDSGPDCNIKLYDLHAAPVFVSTYGVNGGYLDNTTGIKGQVGAMRFTRIKGIGKDKAGNVYVLNNPWGGTWDLGRDGGTDIHCYDTTNTLKWTLQALNFEAIAAPDPLTDAEYFYGGTNIYKGTAGGTFVANTVDPFTYPTDPRINMADGQRGEHFGMIAVVGTNRILVACGQNPDMLYFYHFSPATQGYIAIPDGILPGTLFNATARVRNGFCLASNGDVWAGLDKKNTITRYPLTGFDVNGKPSWGAPMAYPTPSSIGVLGRIIYLPETDTLILANIVGTDWTSIGNRVEVYHGWLAGNRTPLVISLTAANPKTMTASGNYLFVGYVHTVPDIHAFNLTTGTKDLTMTNSNPAAVYVGNDVDSMYGLRSMLRSNGEYVVTKDNYNSTSVVVYRWTP